MQAEPARHRALGSSAESRHPRSPTHVRHIQLFTFGAKHSDKHDIHLPVLCEFDLRKFRAPPRSLTRFYTGLDREVIDNFWSHPEHEHKYQRALTKIKRLVLDLTPADPYNVAVLVYCTAGVHRSVVFMARLFRDLKRWPQVTVSGHHFDLREAIEKRRAPGGYEGD